MEARSFEAVYADDFRSLVGLGFVLCGDWSLAEELAQEAFVAAYRNWDKVGAYDDARAWVRRVLINLATSRWRRRIREARALRTLLSRPVDTPSADPSLLDPEFWAAIRRLPRRQAQCVALRYVDDQSTAGIAKVLGIAEATVRVHLHAGRRALAADLGELVEEYE